MKAVLPYHHIDKLKEDDAWSLLKKQIIWSETDAHEIDRLKDIGLQIVAKCDGLPLAVKVLGGLLCQKGNQYGDWKMVLDSSIWSESGMPEELNHAVYLSYRDLSSPVKQCFLHYSLLPKTAIFLRDEITGMWISEGFLHGSSHDLEELGSEYYKELIVRNLIEPNTKYVDQRVCYMHDVVRSFAQFVARDEALAAHSGETSIVSKLSAQKFLRISIENNESESDGLHWSSLQAQTTLRTLISVGHINTKPGDSLVHFPCLRTLHANSAHAVVFVQSLHEFKHLRYLSLEQSDISTLPESIGKMKFLQYISLEGCQQFVELPRSIVKLGQLRHLNFNKTSINGIPRGFRALTNLRILHGFLAQVDGDWCSLEELGPLCHLKNLDIQGLNNVTVFSSAAKAMLVEKEYLTRLSLTCSSSLGDDVIAIEEDSVSKDKQKQIEKVFYELCPPRGLYYLSIKGYFGLRLPRWMMSSSAATLKSLRILMIEELACCTQLPDGLCQLPCLEIIQIDRAPAIRCIGPEFLQPYHRSHPSPSQVVAAFPRLHQLILYGMVKWVEWEWEEQFQAFPVLHELRIQCCKLWCLPPGLASQARALSILYLENVQGLIYVENFPSLVELAVIGNLNLVRITNVPRLQKLTIITCPELNVLKGVPALQRVVLEDYDMKTLLEYMGSINPSHLELYCSLALLAFIALGQAGPEWDKYSHVEHVKAYAPEGENLRKWYILYTANPYNLETNASRSFMSTGTLSGVEYIQTFESVFKMTRRTFSYICSLVRVTSWKGQNSYTFVDGRVLCLEDRVAVALRRLYSSEPSETLGSFVGVDESTIKLVTARFIADVCKGAMHHMYWPDSSKMDKIKSMFGRIHNMHNCCGVICTTHIPFGQNWEHEKNDSVLMRAVFDPEMRLMDSWLEWEGSMNWSSNLQACDIFKLCEMGIILNGSKLKVALDGSEIGEYIIGDAGYPLLPWLFTPYQEDLQDSKAEFNRRHSAASNCAVKALERFQETWKFLQVQTLCPVNVETLAEAIYACCMLHNIVIDMEDDLAMPSLKYCKEVRQIANEDAIKARDMLSQYFLTTKSSESGVVSVVVNAKEDHEVLSSGSGYEGKNSRGRETMLAR